MRSRNEEPKDYRGGSYADPKARGGAPRGEMPPDHSMPSTGPNDKAKTGSTPAVPDFRGGGALP